jgi:hypothetical protein
VCDNEIRFRYVGGSSGNCGRDILMGRCFATRKRAERYWVCVECCGNMALRFGSVQRGALLDMKWK